MKSCQPSTLPSALSLPILEYSATELETAEFHSGAEAVSCALVSVSPKRFVRQRNITRDLDLFGER